MLRSKKSDKNARSRASGRGVGATESGEGTLFTFAALLAGLSLLRAADAAVVANATSPVTLMPGSLGGA